MMPRMTDITWEDPPAHALTRSGRSKYASFARALRENPERWGVLPSDGERTEKGAHGTAQNIRRGVMSDFKPKGAFETAVDGARVFVRFIGEPDADEQGDDESDEKRDSDSSSESRVVIPEGVQPASASTIRAWARNNGFNVPERGNLPDDVRNAYYRAQQRPRVVR